MLAATLVITEKNSKAFIRNVMTPTRDAVFIFATFITALLTVFVQLILLLLVAILFLGLKVDSSLVLGTFSMLVLASFFIFFGMALGYLFRSEEAVMVASISCSALFLVLSGLILPLEAMPSYFLAYAALNPFVIGETILKMIFLFDYGFLVVAPSLVLISLYTLFTALLIVIAHGFIKKRHLFSSSKKTKR